jgi:type I restriction-modification system DNA methylase subunit
MKGTKQINISFDSLDNKDSINEVINNTLRAIRETLHRSGRLSSRKEGLDELSKLIFSHFVSIENGGTGIDKSILDKNKGSSASLRSFVEKSFREHLPKSLSHELKVDDFKLSLKDSEEKFAEELIQAFEQHSCREPIQKIQGAGQLDILNAIFGNFLADSFIDEKELGQYLTPTEVVNLMVRLGVTSLETEDYAMFCNPSECNRAGFILDPSCGVGSFLAEVIRHFYSKVCDTSSVEDLHLWTSTFLSDVVMGIDKSERMIKLALTNLALFGIPSVNLHLANSLRRFGNEADMTNQLQGTVKLILTNPPFGAEFSGDDIEFYKIATAWSDRSLKSIDSEVLFMERYIDWLAPNGVLVAVVPDSILTNRGLYSNLRRGIMDQVKILSVISLPSVTFGAAGTNTKTSIIHLKKKADSSSKPYPVYFAICNNIGYEVTTRGSQRRKIKTFKNDLPQIQLEIFEHSCREIGQVLEFSCEEERWDATFHAGLPQYVRERIEKNKAHSVLVKHVAVISEERLDPRRKETGKFNYIEISDIDAETLRVHSKEVSTADAPSRARKLVHAGDILFSTVRPERRAVGVVPNHLDEAICSTGFAVLRPQNINSYLLAALLRTDFVNYQVLRNNVGIAYPAIYESCLLDIVLPIDKKKIADLEISASSFQLSLDKLYETKREFNLEVEQSFRAWEMS